MLVPNIFDLIMKDGEWLAAGCRCQCRFPADVNVLHLFSPQMYEFRSMCKKLVDEIRPQVNVRLQVPEICTRVRVPVLSTEYYISDHLPPTKEEVNAIVGVCLSVCQSVSKIRLLKNAWMDCMSTDVRTWKNWLTFEADPDHSPDARTGLLSPISYALQRSEFYYVGKIPRIGIEHGYSPPVAAWFWGVERPLSEVNPLYRVSFVLVRTLT